MSSHNPIANMQSEDQNRTLSEDEPISEVRGAIQLEYALINRNATANATPPKRGVGTECV
jgi:hypothetical protein